MTLFDDSLTPNGDKVKSNAYKFYQTCLGLLHSGLPPITLGRILNAVCLQKITLGVIDAS